MQREYLKGLGLEEETINKIMSEHGKTVNTLNSELAAAKETNEGLQTQLTDRDKDIEDLKKGSSNHEDLQKQLSDLQVKYDEEKTQSEKAIAETKKNAAIDIALTNVKAKNAKAVKALLDGEKIELNEDGSIKGLDEQIETIQQENDFLFGTVEQKQDGPQFLSGGNPNPPQASTKSLTDYNYQELADLKQSDPSAFEALTQNK